MRAPRPSRSFVAGLAVVAFALAACSSTGEQVSDKIAKEAQTKLELSAPPKTTCPDDAKAEKGATFDCSLVVEAATISIKIVFTDDKHFTFTPQSQVFGKSEFVIRVKADTAANNVELKTLTCPGTKFVVVPNSGTIDCKGVDTDGGKGTVRVGLDKDKSPIVKQLIPDK